MGAELGKSRLVGGEGQPREAAVGQQEIIMSLVLTRRLTYNFH